MLRRVLLLLAAIGALGALVVGPAVASGAGAAEAEDRVGAFEQLSGDRAGGHTSEGPARRQGSAANSGQVASAYLVAARGGAGPVRLGQAGESAVRGTYNIGDKVPITVGGRTRIADGLTPTTLSEVKNVGSLSNTRQLRDYAQYAQQTGRTFDLYVRPSTTLSGPLRTATGPGGPINLRYIP